MTAVQYCKPSLDRNVRGHTRSRHHYDVHLAPAAEFRAGPLPQITREIVLDVEAVEPSMEPPMCFISMVSTAPVFLFYASFTSKQYTLHVFRTAVPRTRNAAAYPREPIDKAAHLDHFGRVFWTRNGLNAV